MMPNARYPPDAAELLGAEGEALGVGEIDGSMGYVVEPDVHCNSNRADPSADHLALVALPDYRHVTPPVDLADLEDGVSRHLDVDFNLGALLVAIDGVVVLDTVIEGYVPFEGYLGVTAATGGSNNLQVAEDWSVETGCW
jgi:hypothetical protein